MNHKELIAQIAAETDIPKSTIADVLGHHADFITEALVTDGVVTLHGIGTIQTVDAAAREGRNPATGEVIHIPAKKRIKLKACKALKDAVA